MWFLSRCLTDVQRHIEDHTSQLEASLRMRVRVSGATMIVMPTTSPDIHQPIERLEFGHLQIVFDERVLRPRPWTVAQSQWAAELLHTLPVMGRVLELCAGAGHIGLLALAMGGASTQHRLVAVDASPVACGYARLNADAAGLGSRVDVREGRIEDVLQPDERFDLVIADPPWVPSSDVGRFPRDPVVAIDGGDDGLDVARSCLGAIESHLVPGGSAVLQLGNVDQIERLRDGLDHSSPLSIRETRTFGSHGVLVRLTVGGA